MKDRAPRNRTLTIEESDIPILDSMLHNLSLASSARDIENQVIHADLLECLELLPEQFIDLLVIDPPYNLTKQFGSTKFGKQKDNDYEQWLKLWLPQLKRCCKSNASIYVCCDWQCSASIQRILEENFIIRNRITWEREKGRGALSNWKNCSEDIWFCTVSDEYVFNVDAVKLKKKVIAPYRTADGDPKDWEENQEGNYRLTFPSNLWTDISIPFWSMPENTDHPTQKPEKLIAKLILASSNEGQMVFDPFLGSGTTVVAAKKLARKFCGIEREIEYCRLSLKRLMSAQNDNTIQGYQDGVFWERNSLSDQVEETKRKKKQQAVIGCLFE